jgi:uncharacterized membrane protein YphA (DoxX/SURF4 family)
MTVYSIFGIIGAVAILLTALRYLISKPSNVVICYLQNFVGALFIFSGFVKAVDPLGTGYKMHEYFEAFSQEGLRPLWEWLANFSTFFAIVMIAAELFIGLMLLIGWKPRFTVAIVWWLTLFFTILTGYTYLSGYEITKWMMVQGIATFFVLALIAVFDKSEKQKRVTIVSSVLLIALIGAFVNHFGTHPFVETKMKVTDCGCFGDFMKLKPWETFYKDVILDIMIIVLVIGHKHIRPLFGDTSRAGIAGVTAVASTLFCLYNVYMNEPMIDFRPYAIGSNIPEQRKEKRPAKIEMTFVYKNKTTGESKGYTTAELAGLNYDELEFVERKDVVLDPGIPAKISNLRIEDEEGGDLTDELLSDENYSMMVVSYNLKKTNEEAFKELNQIAAACAKAKVNFYTVTVNDGKVEEFRHRNQTPYPFYHADETPLKTIIRSNPGLVLFKNGTVVNKWHYKHLPSTEDLNKNYFSK